MKPETKHKRNIDVYFKKICECGDPLSFLSKFVAPHLVGNEWGYVRKCFLLMCVTQDRPDMRIRLHTLLNGSPGTGKSEFLNWARKNMDGVMVNAELTSKVGLVGDARGNDITPGLLARSDGDFLLCDELDKMGRDDQDGLLQSMEEGEYTITKGANHERFKAEIRCIAGCNEIDRITKPLLDRFDFVFNLYPVTRKQRAENSRNIISTFVDGSRKNYFKIVKGYIDWVSTDVTEWDKTQLETIYTLIEKYILLTATNIDVVSYRNLELSIMRIAYAMARLERKKVNVTHVKSAIKLKDAILKSLVGNRGGRR